MKSWTIESDFDGIASAAYSDLHQMHGARIFMTGGTGFIGTWVLEALKFAEAKLALDVKVTILTRDRARFESRAPQLAHHKSFEIISGDVMDFVSPRTEFTHIIHGATDASAELNAKNPIAMFDTIVRGTRRILEFAREAGVKRVLHLSSGAVYGKQPWELTHVPEGYVGAPDCTDPINSYAEAKRAAEMLCSIYKKQYNLSVSVARIFALLGPYLSLEIHFAAGNFIRDALQGDTVVVQGDGRPHRSYLYASDLVVWLLALLVRGQSGRAYNVGSSESISIRDLAQRVSTLVGNGEVRVLGSPDGGWNTGRYVPSTNAIEEDLKVKQTVLLDEAIRRTAQWNGWKPWVS